MAKKTTAPAGSLWTRDMIIEYVKVALLLLLLGRTSQPTSSPAGQTFRQWVESNFPTLTDKDSKYVSSLIEQNFKAQNPDERGVLKDFFTKIEHGIYYEGKIRRYDFEQFIWVLYHMSQAWLKTQPGQQTAPPASTATGPTQVGREHIVWWADILTCHFQDAQAETIHEFLHFIEEKGFNSGQLIMDLYSMSMNAKKRAQDPAIKILGDLVNKVSNAERLLNINALCLLTPAEGVSAAPCDPAVKLLREILDLSSDRERVAHLLKTNRLVEMTPRQRAMRAFSKHPGQFLISVGASILGTFIWLAILAF